MNVREGVNKLFEKIQKIGRQIKTAPGGGL
ncbi:hypothetical protein DP119_11185 [Planococcus maitriensis]|uniref:Uncharacterized protein n=1 Tax=Planococcus maitriensis TaxID=221799 RepID=A0A365K3Y5_9BACL|nr:hypothetical protein DP119_11185 [Planococcus maitriensis]